MRVWWHAVQASATLERRSWYSFASLCGSWQAAQPMPLDVRVGLGHSVRDVVEVVILDIPVACMALRAAITVHVVPLRELRKRIGMG